MKKLIINSDDYGRTPDISRGIREAHLRGIVTSTSCMMNIQSTPDDVAVALEEAPRLGMGVHLVLTMGKPLSAHEAVPSIVDENGNFRKYMPFVESLPEIEVDEVKSEWRLQIERFITVTGRNPTHLDSHHHSSYFSVALFRGMLEMAREYKCAIRYPFMTENREIEETGRYAADLMKEFDLKKPDVFYSNFYDEYATQAVLTNLIKSLNNGTSEIMCHPGYVDDTFANESVYNFQRGRELKILTDPSLKQTVLDNGIELITFADL